MNQDPTSVPPTAPDPGSPTPAPEGLAPPTEASAAPTLQPGRGAPLVAGPPASVGQPLAAGRINRLFGISGLLLILAVIVIVVIIGAVIIGAVNHKPG